MDFGLIGIGFMSGVSYAIAGYFKEYGQKSESFNIYKAAPAVVIGGILGGVGAVFNLQTDAAFTFFGFWGIVSAVENVLKGINAKITPPKK